MERKKEKERKRQGKSEMVRDRWNGRVSGFLARDITERKMNEFLVARI